MFGVDLLVLVAFQVILTGLAVLVFYLVVKAAVRNGTLEAHRRLDRERPASATDARPSS